MNAPTATWSRSFAAVAFLLGRGWKVEAAELSKDGSGGVVFKLPLAAQGDLQEWYRIKDELNMRSLAARGR
jgi:hypothetical protein